MDTASAAPAIDARDLIKRYGRIAALNGLSLVVQPGEIFGLLGANGAGKTTLIRILTGVTRHDSGAVRVLGLDPITDARRLRPQIGYMPQSPALYEDLSARDNVRFFAQAHQLDDTNRRVDSILDFLRLGDRKHDPVHTFSGGMKQRVSLACALVHGPRLLCLDEPSSGVDLRLRKALWSHLRELAAQGTTILVSTHQMDEALHCDRVAVVRAGVALAVDTAAGLLARGRTQVTIWRGETPETVTVDDYPAHLLGLVGAGADVSRVEVRQDTLEDVVLRLIEEQQADLQVGGS